MGGCHPIAVQPLIHKAKHLHSWKTLVKAKKEWPAIREALRDNVDVAITLFPNGAWCAR